MKIQTSNTTEKCVYFVATTLNKLSCLFNNMKINRKQRKYIIHKTKNSKIHN